jgi:hypothetical protein
MLPMGKKEKSRRQQHSRKRQTKIGNQGVRVGTRRHTCRLSGELVDVDEVAVDAEERGVLRKELLESGLRPAGDLSHLLGEALGPKLAAEVMQGARTALVHQPLKEEEQSLVAHHLILAAVHIGCSPAQILRPNDSGSGPRPTTPPPYLI